MSAYLDTHTHANSHTQTHTYTHNHSYSHTLPSIYRVGKISRLSYESPRTVLLKMLDGTAATLRTNFFNDDRYALSLRVTLYSRLLFYSILFFSTSPSHCTCLLFFPCFILFLLRIPCLFIPLCFAPFNNLIIPKTSLTIPYLNFYRIPYTVY